SESLPLRRWPCWPGPYSRRLTGLLGRPQMFSPIRRSILYFDSMRLVIRVLDFAVLLRIAPSFVPAGPEPTGWTSKAQGPAAGRETPRRPLNGRRGSGFLGRNHLFCQIPWVWKDLTAVMISLRSGHRSNARHGAVRRTAAA